MRGLPSFCLNFNENGPFGAHFSEIGVYFHDLMVILKVKMCFKSDFKLSNSILKN